MPVILNACFIDLILPRVDEYCKCFRTILKTFVKMHKYRPRDLDKFKNYRRTLGRLRRNRATAANSR